MGANSLITLGFDHGTLDFCINSEYWGKDPLVPYTVGIMYLKFLSLVLHSVVLDPTFV